MPLYLATVSCMPKTIAGPGASRTPSNGDAPGWYFVLPPGTSFQILWENINQRRVERDLSMNARNNDAKSRFTNGRGQARIASDRFVFMGIDSWRDRDIQTTFMPGN